MKRILMSAVLAAVAAAIFTAPGSGSHGCLACGPVLMPRVLLVPAVHHAKPRIHHAARHLSCFICAVGEEPGPAAGICDGHGGVADAFTEEAEHDGGIWLQNGVYCADGTRIVFYEDYIGPTASEPAPQPDPFIPYDDPPPSDPGSGCDPGDWC